MSGIMGPLVPKIKAIVSHDYNSVSGHNVPMDQDDETIAETAWREAFCGRLREIQGDRGDNQMALILGITRDRWSKYLNRGSAVPIRLLPKIAAIGGKPTDWLIDGEPAAKRAKEPVKQPKRARQR
jgi:hypothetical protein